MIFNQISIKSRNQITLCKGHVEPFPIVLYGSLAPWTSPPRHLSFKQMDPTDFVKRYYELFDGGRARLAPFYVRR